MMYDAITESTFNLGHTRALGSGASLATSSCLMQVAFVGLAPAVAPAIVPLLAKLIVAQLVLACVEVRS